MSPAHRRVQGPFYYVEIPPEVADIVRGLPPEVKRQTKQALIRLAETPGAGKLLTGDLAGLRSYRARRFCCMVYTNREFLRKHPVATKRALRAILKAADVCAREPERAAQFLVDKGYTTSYDYALQTMKDVGYGQWWEYNPEDTVRSYALRLQEAGMIKSTPQKIIAQGTDWRFLSELKRELKG